MAPGILSDTPSNGLLKHAPRVKVSDLPGSLPTTPVPPDVDVEEVAQSQLPHLLSLSSEDLLEPAIWRDCLALTGAFRTFYSAQSVAQAWKSTFSSQSTTDLTLVPKTARVFQVLDVSSWVEAEFTFKTSAGGPQRTSSGIISIARDDNNGWKIWMIRTTLEGIEGYGDVDVLNPVFPREAVGESSVGITNGQLKQGYPQHLDVIVVGGGQAGLGVGGRLQALGVSYVVVDKFNTVGDSWNTRYETTKREIPLLVSLRTRF